MLIHDEKGQIGVDQRRKLGAVALDLLIRQLHGAIQRRIAGVDQLEKPGDQAKVVQPRFRLENMEIAALCHKLRQLAPPLDHLFVRGNLNQIFDPVHILYIAQAGHVIDIVGVVIIGEKAAAAVKTLYQHTLPVKVGKAQRSVDLIAAHFLCPALHRVEQGVGHLLIVDKIHLCEAHAVGVPFFVGLAAEDRADAPHHFAVAHGQPAAGLAVFKRGILFAVPVAHVVVKGSGNELGYVFIQNIRVFHKLAQLRPCSHFNNRNHMMLLLADTAPVYRNIRQKATEKVW